MFFGFLMVGLKKLCYMKKMVSVVGLSGKPFFLESVSFPLERFDVTNFLLALVVCNVHVVIYFFLPGKTGSGSVFVNC